MTVSDRDRAWMTKLAELLSESESRTPATPAQRRQIREFSNPRRAALGLPPLEDDDNDEIPESEGCFPAVNALLEQLHARWTVSGAVAAAS